MPSNIIDLIGPAGLAFFITLLSFLYNFYYKHPKLSFPFKHKQCFIRNYSSNCRNKNASHQVKLKPSLTGKDSPTQASKKIYLDADKQKVSIVTENRHLCGVYKWTNKLNGKVYIGSSANLSKRLSNYYSFGLPLAVML